MIRYHFIGLLLLTILMRRSLAQALVTDRNTQAAIARDTRSMSGLPGKKYWQNSAVYDIDVSFDPLSCVVDGFVEIDYLNNSPDTLKTLLFKLYPNLYKSNSMRNSVISTKDLSDGVKIRSMKIGDSTIDSTQRRMRGTNMYVDGNRILPSQNIKVRVEFSYTLNKGSFNRTGKIEDGSFFIAYFFPRLAVYDDIEEWNEIPYLGKEEFYNDYCDFNVRITVPGTYQAWATGELRNGSNIFEPTFFERIKRAEGSDKTVDIITPEDLKQGHITQDKPTHTWFFQAKNVTDFAFAISNRNVWKASSIVVDPNTKRRTLVNAVFSPNHASYTSVVSYARKTVELMSYQFPAVPFPYPHITIVDGLDAMEYPMMVNNLPFKDKKEMIQFTAHEVFHSLFPFFVGTNETRYSFMDEGWATMTEFMFLPEIEPELDSAYDLSSINDYAGLSEDMPVMTPTPQLYGKARFADKDLKPALSLYYLKEMLGDALFLKGMKYYISSWAGKHPTPYDFFNTMNVATGKDLNWFWNSWYFMKAVPDLKIDHVIKKGSMYTIQVTSPGNAVMPVHLTVLYADGSSELLNRNVEVWSAGARSISILFKAKGKVRKIVLGNGLDVDVNPGDNYWMAP